MLRLCLIVLVTCLASACSMNQMMVRASLPMIDGGIKALNMETDLELAEDAIPTNIELLEGMIVIDPENITLRNYAAQAYYGLGYGFNEDKRPGRASNFYKRGLKHGLTALSLNGLDNAATISIEQLESDLLETDEDDVAALFWTASNWAKWIDMNRDKPETIAQLPRPTALMQRVLAQDETFYYGGAHMYFGVYYGGRSPMFGGDFAKAEEHFDRAREITDGKLLVADLLQAQFLSRQKFDEEDFVNRLTKIIESPDDLLPELALLNKICKRKAKNLLEMKESWF